MSFYLQLVYNLLHVEDGGRDLPRFCPFCLRIYFASECYYLIFHRAFDAIAKLGFDERCFEVVRDSIVEGRINILGIGFAADGSDCNLICNDLRAGKSKWNI